jgi:F0F1-type ATP synthase membrane subunit c/vacuolar-type H+-ATPase subunit K
MAPSAVAERQDPAPRRAVPGRESAVGALAPVIPLRRARPTDAAPAGSPAPQRLVGCTGPSLRPAGSRERVVERPGVGRARARRPVGEARHRLRRVVAGLAVTLASTAVVVGLGLIADAAGTAAARSTVPDGTRLVVTGLSDTAWDVARRVAPEADAAAVVERILADNGLTSVALEPGRTLRVPA